MSDSDTLHVVMYPIFKWVTTGLNYISLAEAQSLNRERSPVLEVEPWTEEEKIILTLIVQMKTFVTLLSKLVNEI